ncbi:flagellar basal body rod protein FlgB [Camelliibacillus cellulosilyticus]|uniref:Flagellar basal body rod protein FlgB n=1 Tax=Camelliibacillus cellulosilyticus TaxID=2174486 RepID=A0ABV9GJR6_9BACL
MDFFGTTSISSLTRALNRADLTHQVIAQNIANIDTPGYKAEKVVFNDALQSAIEARRTDPRHFNFSGTDDNPKVVKDRTTAVQNNGNNVDIDKEMVALANNQIGYQAYAEAISRKFNEWNIVLKGGE